LQVELVLQTPGTRAWTCQWDKNCSFESSIVFLFYRRLHSKQLFYLHTLILLSWRRKISCIVLCCSYLWVINLYVCSNKWGN